MDDLVERMAHAICREDGQDWETLSASYDGRMRLNDYKRFARAAVAKCFNWQPISTAPKDGTPIITAFKQSGCVKKVQWVDFGEGDEELNGWHETIGRVWCRQKWEQPVLWVPYFEPPKETKKEKQG